MDPSSWKAVTEGSEAAFDGDLSTEWKAEGLIPLVIDMGKTAVISDGEFSNIMHNPVPFRVSFKKPCRARFFKLIPRQEISGNNITSTGEIGILQ